MIFAQWLLLLWSSYVENQTGISSWRNQFSSFLQSFDYYLVGREGSFHLNMEFDGFLSNFVAIYAIRSGNPIGVLGKWFLLVIRCLGCVSHSVLSSCTLIFLTDHENCFVWIEFRHYLVEIHVCNRGNFQSIFPLSPFFSFLSVYNDWLQIFCFPI